eukprot:CAMPEP_0197827624 /NCGR_PEP_ID=MMETSP1437-20131217/4363_1 /TAXON_ID=49252 ORGANISM="Eucampia antarctica, Strain CCMP1452" /NCGR_SAMPLE_ID=MMETSP1437 /ASSEMBLY_ACC=CAM_ASM_001096 /LENGTH=502 /DNA_ID=CAMNT_0043428545 /DNA_START=110 /DNA_END=1618 /DNA_ORIENTATION=-
MTSSGGLTSTTAPAKIFASRGDLANHYKSDWHKYNLKRREAGMAMLEEEDFCARLEAALALRKEREGRELRTGKDHLKKNSTSSKRKQEKKTKRKSDDNHNNHNNNTHVDTASSQPKVTSPNVDSTTIISSNNNNDMDIGNSTTTISNDETAQNPTEDVQTHNSSTKMEEEPPIIDPRQCLFDNHMCASVEENIERMYKKYGFYIPDQEYLIDAETLIGYCTEKVKLGHLCLYCQKTFSTSRGCQEHMIMTGHTKLRYERGIDQEDFDVFYDFSEADAEFLGTTKEEAKQKKANFNDNNMDVEDDVDDGGEWEDIDEGDEKMADEDEDGVYGAYKDEIARHGFDITPLGELVFPDGRIIGHRGLSRYYKQRFTSDYANRTAVVAARRAAGERIYQGKVYETYQPASVGGNSSASALTLAKAGIAPGAGGGGRHSRGVLVPSNGGGNSFTALSLYRYQAVLKKSRREENRGRRLQQRTTLPMNKMDKKANRLFNGVSVAHAAR